MPREKTGTLPGMERKGIKEIEKLADRYAEIRDERMALTESEVDAKAKLIDAMHKHNQTEYVFEDDGYTVTVEIKATDETVKVRRKKKAEDESDPSDN